MRKMDLFLAFFRVSYYFYGKLPMAAGLIVSGADAFADPHSESLS
jgi:hypothetical protein